MFEPVPELEPLILQEVILGWVVMEVRLEFILKLILRDVRLSDRFKRAQVVVDSLSPRHVVVQVRPVP